jgi:hypothetical protein
MVWERVQVGTSSCCLNTCRLRTSFHVFTLDLSEPVSRSDNLPRFPARPVRTCAHFGQPPSFPSSTCPNLQRLRTTFYFFPPILSEPTTTSDNLTRFSLELSEPAPTSDNLPLLPAGSVRTHNNFGQPSTFSRPSCPNLQRLRTTSLLFPPILSEPTTTSDNLLLFPARPVRTHTNFGQSSTFPR